MHRGAESGGGIDIRRLDLEEVLTIRRQPRQDSILFTFLFIYFPFLSLPELCTPHQCPGPSHVLAPSARQSCWTHMVPQQRPLCLA